MKDLQFRSSKSQVMNINMKTFVRVIHFPFMKEEKRTRNSKLNKKKKATKDLWSVGLSSFIYITTACVGELLAVATEASSSFHLSWCLL